MTLLTGAEVLSLETGSGGREVTGVVVSRDGQREVYQGDIVALSAGAANSAKILLRSASDEHPDGLANSSGQVGRNYMFHNSLAMVALGKERNDTVYQKSSRPSTTSTRPVTAASTRWCRSRCWASRTPRR